MNWSGASRTEETASRTGERQVVLLKRQVETAETTSRTDEQQVEPLKQQVEDPDKCDVFARLETRGVKEEAKREEHWIS